MSEESVYTLNHDVLVGMTSLRGDAWHRDEQYQLPWEIILPDGRVLDGVGNHYEGAIPVEHVNHRLFGWLAAPRRVAIEIPAPLSEFDHYSADGKPMRWAVTWCGPTGTFRSRYRPLFCVSAPTPVPGMNTWTAAIGWFEF